MKAFLFLPFESRNPNRGKKIITEIPKPVKHANRIYFIFKFVSVSG